MTDKPLKTLQQRIDEQKVKKQETDEQLETAIQIASALADEVRPHAGETALERNKLQIFDQTRENVLTVEVRAADAYTVHKRPNNETDRFYGTGTQVAMNRDEMLDEILRFTGHLT